METVKLLILIFISIPFNINYSTPYGQATRIDSSKSNCYNSLQNLNPGLNPEIFLPDLISQTSRNNLNSVFFPDFKEFYFSTLINER